MTTLQQLGIDRMSVAERLSLAHLILESVAEEQPQPSLSERKCRELDRRLADANANPTDGVPWEEVEAAALARFRQ